MTFITATKGVATAGVLSLLLLAGAGEGQAQREDGDSRTVRGTIETFTEAPKGEKDGAKLKDGTVIHWPPHLAGRFSAVARKGDRIEVRGRYETLKEGQRVFEARRVKNVATGASFTKEDDDPPPPKGKKGKDRKDKKDKEDFKGKDKKDRDDPKAKDDPKGKDGPRGGGPADLERRIQRLEDKIDRLIDELMRSRGEKLKGRPRQE